MKALKITNMLLLAALSAPTRTWLETHPQITVAQSRDIPGLCIVRIDGEVDVTSPKHDEKHDWGTRYLVVIYDAVTGGEFGMLHYVCHPDVSRNTLSLG